MHQLLDPPLPGRRFQRMAREAHPASRRLPRDSRGAATRDDHRRYGVDVMTIMADPKMIPEITGSAVNRHEIASRWASFG